MIKKIMYVLFGIIYSTLVKCQPDNQKFIKSFPINDKCEIISTRGMVVNASIKMSKEDAAKYVYNGDTTKLYCPELEFLGGYEKSNIVGKYNAEYIPNKCFRVDYDKFVLLAYSFYECNPDGFNHIVYGRFDIFDKNYVKTDSLCVFKEMYDDDICGFFNPQNHKIYLYDMSNLNSKKSLMYNINENSLKFEEIQRYEGDLNATLKDQLKKLGWEELFYGDDCQ